MSISIPVSLGERSYNVVIAAGALKRADTLLAPHIGERRTVIITDANVAPFHLAVLQAALPQAKAIVLPAGERTKNWVQLGALVDQLLADGIERSDYLIALGGGVIGDLVGFAAAILKRGCRFIQIPTTLLAQVDSSVGGKTAINTAAGKNLVGAFYQPSLVIIDPDVLDTLPQRDLRAGYAEVVKYGLINDPDFFVWCDTHAVELLAGDSAARIHAIATSVRAKAQIVAADERETANLRALLNLGHTFGHALEAEAGFSGALLHGEAVAAGMALAYQFSATLGLCGNDAAATVSHHLAQVGLPNGLRAAGITASGATLVAHMLHDKKMSGGSLPFILARGIGQAFVDKSVALDAVAEFLNQQP